MSHSGNTEEVEVNLPDDVLFELMMMAHEQDITLNQLVNNILREQLAQEQT
jgi:predicted HicB family RNase H-like nuclease